MEQGVDHDHAGEALAWKLLRHDVAVKEPGTRQVSSGTLDLTG
jgi:hypothetical protein